MSETTSKTAFPPEIVIDEDLQHLSSFISENLSEDRERLWSLQFSSATQTCADTSNVVDRFITAVMRGLYAAAEDTPPEWAAIALLVADGIDAGWSVGDWLSLRTEFPDQSWGLPQRAVTYLLTRLRGGGFIRRDAFRDFLLHAEQYDAGLEWTADILLALLTRGPNRDNKNGL